MQLENVVTSGAGERVPGGILIIVFVRYCRHVRMGVVVKVVFVCAGDSSIRTAAECRLPDSSASHQLLPNNVSWEPVITAFAALPCVMARLLEIGWPHRCISFQPDRVLANGPHSALSPGRPVRIIGDALKYECAWCEEAVGASRQHRRKPVSSANASIHAAS